MHYCAGVQPYGPPGYGPPPAPARPKKGRGWVTVLVVVLAAVLLLCCAPIGVFTTRYLTYEAGPHHRLPNVCAALDGDEVRQFVGDVDGKHQRADVDGAPQDSCLWVSAAEPKRVVMIHANLYGRRWNRSSLDQARRLYQLGVKLAEDSVGGPAAERRLIAGQQGDCFAGSSELSNLHFACQLRDGNVVIDFDVIAARVDQSRSRILTESELYTAISTFVDGIGHQLAEDLIEDL